MGKIVKLKNKKTGVKVYPVTATSAVVDANSGERLNDTLQNKVEEAPMDGNQYARINGAWAKVEGGGDETALITLLPNSADLYGATVKVTTESGETLLDTTWQGAALSVVIPAKIVYTITVGEKDGYVAPNAVTHTAVSGGVRSIAMTYTVSTLTLGILSNQGESDSDISGIKATVSYGGTSVQVGNGEKISLPLNVEVTITFPSVTNYKVPDFIRFTHAGGAVVKSGTYQTEIVSVSLSANNGDNLVGQIVNINGTEHIWNGTAVKQKVAYGVSYTVYANEKDGYMLGSSQTFTADSTSRDVTVTYYYRYGTKTPSPGIYIQDTEGYCLTAEEWGKSINLTPNGVAVVTEERSFVIAISVAANGFARAWGDETVLIDNIVTTTSESTALADYDGQGNTDKIVSQLSGSSAANFCKQFVFPNGKNGYLGSLGEWQIAFDNKAAIVTCFDLIGGFLDSGSWVLVTSTQVDTSKYWGHRYDSPMKVSKSTETHIIAFTTL